MDRIFRITITLIAFTLSSQGFAQSTALSKYDQIKAKVQRICPVSGELLGSMGDPLKVRIGQEDIFLCCKSCAKGQINKTHWVTIHQNFALAQGICPVMEKPLPKNPKATTVNGQTVYICCPPCSKKIQADPKKYLTKLAGYYQTALAGKTVTKSQTAAVGQLSNRDQLKVAIQKVCPVSGNALGANGTPQKVRAGGVDVFLCCGGCKEGKINKDHWAKVVGNIAGAQGFCPVMEKKLPANAKSTVVDGQLIFVCCPPCTKKIEKEPAKFLAKIDSYYMASLKGNAVKR